MLTSLRFLPSSASAAPVSVGSRVSVSLDFNVDHVCVRPGVRGRGLASHLSPLSFSISLPCVPLLVPPQHTQTPPLHRPPLPLARRHRRARARKRRRPPPSPSYLTASEKGSGSGKASEGEAFEPRQSLRVRALGVRSRKRVGWGRGGGEFGVAFIPLRASAVVASVPVSAVIALCSARRGRMRMFRAKQGREARTRGQRGGRGPAEEFSRARVGRLEPAWAPS
ncbi:hypothetical protein C8R44DRAFT_761989 [Mycena epipterygia]|nr:hypothetical protein C8R44DRAFT_761989 [Mycena epipterygia]